MLQCCNKCSFAKKFLTKTDWCAGACFVKEKRTIGSPFFGVFPSDHISKAMKYANIHVIHSSNSCKLYQQILGTFRSYLKKKKRVGG